MLFWSITKVALGTEWPWLLSPYLPAICFLSQSLLNYNILQCLECHLSDLSPTLRTCHLRYNYLKKVDNQPFLWNMSMIPMWQVAMCPFQVLLRLPFLSVLYGRELKCEIYIIFFPNWKKVMYRAFFHVMSFLLPPLHFQRNSIKKDGCKVERSSRSLHKTIKWSKRL